MLLERPELSACATEIVNVLIWVDGRAHADNKGFVLLEDAFAAGRLSAQDLKLILPDVYTYCDRMTMAIPPDRWVEMFRAAGFCSPGERPAPSSPLTVFRGAPAWLWQGMSWTLRTRTAAFYASIRTRGVVVSTQVAPDAVLAVFDDPPEWPGREVVVDPSMLDDVKVVGGAALEALVRRQTGEVKRMSDAYHGLCGREP